MLKGDERERLCFTVELPLKFNISSRAITSEPLKAIKANWQHDTNQIDEDTPHSFRMSGNIYFFEVDQFPI